MINGGSIDIATVGTFVPWDDEFYQFWLRNPSANVGHIVHIGYHGGSPVYPNWVKFTLKLSDFPLAGYREVVRSIPSFTRAISADLSGEVTSSLGDLVLDNTDGTLDTWPNLSLDGQPVRVYHGDPTWAPERFRLIYECIAEIVTGATQDSVSIRLRGLEHGANLPIQTTLIPAAVGATAPSNQVMPKAYGAVFNITPALIEEANQIYQWNDRGFNTISDVRDGGIPFRTNQIAISAVNTASDLISTAAAHGFYQNTRIRCDLGSLPTSGGSGSWSIAWNGQLYCAIFNTGSNALSATSTDGLNWTAGTLPAVANWSAIVWNGRVFCARASLSTNVATSPDGITWTLGALPSSQTWSGMAWNGAVFALLSTVSSSVAATSTDGLVWTARTMPSAANWQGICWSNTLQMFCAVAGSSTKAATSPDGITWTARTLPSSSTWERVVWGGDRFVATTGSASNVAAYSLDGVTWVATTLSSSANWYGLAWSGSVFVVVGPSIACSSPDGITWTARTIPPWNWATVMWDGYKFIASASNNNVPTFSYDGITWSGVDNTLPAPLATNTDYWVSPTGLTSTDFKLTAARGGTTVIDLTSAATGAVIIGYHWTSQNSRRQVVLDSRPAGVLTLDGVASSLTADVIIPLVLGAVNVDTVAVAKFALVCPQKVGVYLGERRNRLDVAHEIMSGLGAWYGYNRYSLLKMGRIEGAYTTHDFEIIEDQMDDGSFAIERMIPPVKRHRISYRKNYTNQKDNLFAGVSPEARGLYSADYSVSTPVLGADEGPNDEEFHLLAIKPEVIESLMTYGNDAAVEAARRNAMFYGWGVIYRCTVGLVGAEMDPGHVVKVTHRRYGLSAGVRMALVHVEDQPSNRSTVLKLFQGSLAFPDDAGAAFSFSDVSLLLHFDGANGGTTFTDSSSYNTLMVNNGSSTQTSQFKYGTASGYFGSTSNIVVSTQTPRINSLPGDFTIQTWIRFNGYSASWGGTYGSVICSNYDTALYDGIYWGIFGTASSWSTMQFFTGATTLNWANSFSNNQWYFVEICRVSGVFYAFVDGILIGSAANTDSCSPTNTNAIFNVGWRGDAPYYFPVKGWLDDFRLIKGIGLHTGNYAVPTAAFPNA